MRLRPFQTELRQSFIAFCRFYLFTAVNRIERGGVLHPVTLFSPIVPRGDGPSADDNIGAVWPSMRPNTNRRFSLETFARDASSAAAIINVAATATITS